MTNTISIGYFLDDLNEEEERIYEIENSVYEEFVFPSMSGSNAFIPE